MRDGGSMGDGRRGPGATGQYAASEDRAGEYQNRNRSGRLARRRGHSQVSEIRRRNTSKGLAGFRTIYREFTGPRTAAAISSKILTKDSDLVVYSTQIHPEWIKN